MIHIKDALAAGDAVIHSRVIHNLRRLHPGESSSRCLGNAWVSGDIVRRSSGITLRPLKDVRGSVVIAGEEIQVTAHLMINAKAVGISGSRIGVGGLVGRYARAGGGIGSICCRQWKHIYKGLDRGYSRSTRGQVGDSGQ